MPNLMTRGATWHSTMLKRAGGRSVVWRRGNGTPVTLTATPTLHIYEVLGSDGLVTQVESWDWTITAADLGQKLIPGDELLETINGVATVYEVFEIGDKPCYEWADTAGIELVIHSRKTEEAE